jgi:hypothetical protein
VQALEPCQLDKVQRACQFRPEFGRLELRDQLAMMANCFQIVGPELRACSAKRDRLDEYIAEDPKSGQDR